MSNLTAQFSKNAAKFDAMRDSLTVMFADTRHGMHGKTAEAFSRLKKRAATNPQVAGYVAKVEASVARYAHAAPRATASALKR